MATSFSYRPKVLPLIVAAVVGLAALILVPWLGFTEGGDAWWFGIVVAVAGLLLLIAVVARRPGGTHLLIDGSVLTVRGRRSVSVDLAQMEAVGSIRGVRTYLAARPGATGVGEVRNTGTDLYPVFVAQWKLVRLVNPATWDRPAEEVVAAVKEASGQNWVEHLAPPT